MANFDKVRYCGYPGSEVLTPSSEVGSMNVSLTPELEQLIHKKVETGLYLSASEVVREALRLLDERDKLQAMKFEELRREIQVGIDQADRGELLEGPEAFEKVRAKVRGRAANGRGK
jgi:antitoxin ParD1/3/4